MQEGRKPGGAVGRLDQEQAGTSRSESFEEGLGGGGSQEEQTGPDKLALGSPMRTPNSYRPAIGMEGGRAGLLTSEEEEEEWVDYSVNEGFGELWADRTERVKAASPHSALPGWKLVALIAKANDELLQEQLAVSCISLIQQVGVG